MAVSRQGGGMVTPALVTMAVGLVMEIGQLFLPTRTPSVTDVLLAGVGGLVGSWLVGWVEDPVPSPVRVRENKVPEAMFLLRG
jgi:hypothetical protein